MAVNSYVQSLKQLLLCGAALALFMVLVQAGTGWKKGVVIKDEDSGLLGNEVENESIVDNEEWEEGIEQGV